MNADQVSNDSSDKQISLPEPDPDNITVLTKELPNEPILPWHRYDSPWLEGEEKERAEVEREAQSGHADAQETSEEKSETLLVELKEKIEAEIELLEQTEPKTQTAETDQDEEEIAELARELASKLEAKKAVATEAQTHENQAQAEQDVTEVQLEITLAGESEGLIEERDEVD